MSDVHPFQERLRAVDLVSRTGRVRRILPTFVEADGPSVPLGALCALETRTAAGRDRSEILAEVVSVNRDSVILVPFDNASPTFSGARVTACVEAETVPVGDAFLGRAIDALGRPIDGLGEIRADRAGRLGGEATTPLDRTSPRKVLETGVRAIDGLLTLGHGQRVGVFAASGVGKTSLMAQLARQIDADACVVCLVGERGREVEALWSSGLSTEARSRTTLVAATSDQTAAMRVRAGDYALTLADYWRRQGLHVLLLLDSVTRLAMAMREIGLAAGEPPTVRAYTPGVFAQIPRLVERCGALKVGGSITAIMTILSETDDVDDPVSEMMKSLLDGHIILSRNLAEQGCFPAIDAPRSVSRQAGELAGAARVDASTALEMLSVYEQSRTLIESGVYVRGANAEIDRALDRRPALLAFLQQGQHEHTPLDDCRASLGRAVGAQS
jgi:flagellum-specific ATP synthase